jgi:hypothetical protein
LSVQALSCAFAMRGIGSSEKLVLLALANFCNDKFECWPSQERLAADTELGERTVWNALKGLEAKGILTRSRRTRQDGSRTSDRITLHFSLTITAEPVADAAEPTRKICEAYPQDLQGLVAPVATLTTFEPSEEPSAKKESATRLPEGWVPEPDDFLKALDLIGAERATTELEKFTDYWRSIPGGKAKKLDWSATYRNWIRRASESTPRNDRPDRRLAERHDNYADSWSGADRAAEVLAARRAF